MTPTSSRPRPASPSLQVDQTDVRADGDRLSAFVRLLERVTGREVKVVPPFAYLVSAPPKPEPKRESAPEITLPANFEGIQRRESGPLVVDISNVLRHGTADRMVLTPKSDGGLALFSPVDVAI